MKENLIEEEITEDNPLIIPIPEDNEVLWVFKGKATWRNNILIKVEKDIYEYRSYSKCKKIHFY